MDFSAYTEKNIGQFNGKLPGLPPIARPALGRVVLYVFLFPLGMGMYIVLCSLLVAIWKPLGTAAFIGGLALPILSWRFLGKQMNSGYDYAIRMALFAQRNKFTYHYQGPPYDHKGAISSVLGSPMTSNVVTGLLGKTPFELCTTYGKGFYVVLQIKLPNKYPHILLDAKANNFGISNLLSKFPESKEVRLEGDFGKAFKVFSAGSSVETLQVLSPELMARMLDYPRQADIEIVDNRLQLVLNYKTLKEEDLRMLFASAEQILKDIGSSSNNAKVSFSSSERID